MYRALLMSLVVALPLLAVDPPKKADPKDSPRVLYPIPLAAAPGQKTKIILRGFKLDTVTEVKAGDDKVKVKLVGKPKPAGGPTNFPAERIGDSECEIELDVPKDFPAGHLELTAVSSGGSSPYGFVTDALTAASRGRSSAPYKFVIDAGPRTVEKEPNDSFAKAQEITVPTTVDAAIGQVRDVDVFRFVGKAGDKVRFEVQASRLGSPVDALITLYDADRRIIDACDDVDGDPDPILTVTLPKNGVYYLSVIEAHDFGGGQFPYRLHVTK
ncbi:PPC domain-containing protein [Fimbriiglobus ruber]|uniref:Putative serine proteinase, subtilase family n=1 Tax=Fimbriiglobus ruber TaxID=1908690 RepID=A0A225DJE6_9BACT|nr:PPC domain-containing protein [Fimbriiglobus ruber]OWK36515.1 putative serine proteinase, subtilase family [Fimbriiglobus ruber]